MENRLIIKRPNKLILIIDDSRTQALALTDLLERNGLDVLWASDGPAGLSMARCYLPDLIVLDFHMPGMNGLEVCERLRKNPITANLPIILFTSHADIEVMKMGLAKGVVDFIPKDAFSDVVLLETLRQMDLIAPQPTLSDRV